MKVTPRVYLTCLLSVLFLLLLPVVACNSSEGSGDPTGGSGTGNLQVNLTDAPIDMSDVLSVDVDITGVIVYGAMVSGGAEPPPVQLLTAPASFDLMTLTGGATELLASGELPAGMYNRIRLEISGASITFQDLTTETLKIESSKVDVPIPFDLAADETMVITLDFQADRSIHVNHTGSDKYILRPVVTPVSGV